jgi:hypothetical protein
MRGDYDWSRDYGVDRYFLNPEEEREYCDTMARIPRAAYGHMFDLKMDSYCELMDFPEEHCAHFEYMTWQEKDYGVRPKFAGVWSEIMKTPDRELLDNDEMRQFM